MLTSTLSDSFRRRRSPSGVRLGGVTRLLGLQVRLNDHREGVGRGIQLRPAGAVVEQLDAGETDTDLTALALPAEALRGASRDARRSARPG